MDLSRLKLKGNSNYKLEVRNADNPLVLKYSHERDERLLKSALKQATFKSNYFETPTVTYIKDELIESAFEMKFIQGNSFVEFFMNASKNDLDSLIKTLKGYFNETIKEERVFQIKYFHTKIEEIGESGYSHVIPNIGGIKMYVGECHGDMTFSNMIFSDKFYLIDFLDSYIESPTMDLVKLRQDTHLFYSLNMVKQQNIDTTKIKIGLNYIDDWITSTYNIEYYETLQIINLLRIKAYSDKKLQKYLKQKIDELWHH